MTSPNCCVGKAFYWGVTIIILFGG